MPDAPPEPIPESGHLMMLTFEHFGMRNEDYVPAVSPSDNLDFLNQAIAWSAYWKQPVYGLPGKYRIAKSSIANSVILLTDCHVICLPGCAIKRGFSNGTAGIITADNVQNIVWDGGRVEWYDAGSGLPDGAVLKIFSGTTLRSTDIVIKNLTIKGYRADSAIGINGDRITLINPTIIDPDDENSNGIRVGSGTGFRCYGGFVASGGDAALQFSSTPSNGDITDGYYIGTRASSVGGRLLLVGTQFGSIRQVGFIGCSGTCTGDANLMQIQNLTTSQVVSGVLVRNCALSRPDDTAVDKVGIIVENRSAATGALSHVSFDNLVVDYPGGTALHLFTTPTAAVPSPDPVRAFAWRGGRIAHVDAGGRAITVDRVEGALFARLAISGATDQQLILVGATAPAANVVFEDVSLAAVAAGKVGVVFDLATACGWRRGAIAGAASATAARLTANSRGCFVTGANLGAIGADPKVMVAAAVPAAPLVRDNFGSTQRTPLTLGGFVRTPLGAQAITAVSAQAGVDPGTGGTSLRTVNGGAEGDLLVVSPWSASAHVQLKDGTGNLRLPANFNMTDPADTALLVRRGGERLRLARAANG